VERNVAIELAKQNINLKVIGLKDDFSIEDINRWYPVVPEHTKILGPRTIGYSPTLLSELEQVSAQLGHVHTIWDYTAYAIYKWAKSKKVPFICSVHGSLNKRALAVSPFKKSIASKLYVKKVLEEVNCMQVSTLDEYRQVRKFGFAKPICVISNGIHLPDRQEKFDIPWKSEKTAGKKILLYIGRIHPTKGIHHLVSGWDLIAKKHASNLKEWHLVLVGFGFYEKSVYEDKIKSQIDDLNLKNDITILPPHFGEKMKACYEHCDSFILPSEHEGFSMALLTAMAYQKVVLMTPECQFPEAFEKDAAIEIGCSPEGVKKGLLKLFDCSEDNKKSIANRGYSIVAEKYTWEKITGQLIDVYSWLINSDTPPVSVVDDEFTYK